MEGTQSGSPLPTGRWSSITAPTLILTGEKSDAFLQQAGNALAEVLPNPQHDTLQGANHSAVVAAPKALAAMLEEAGVRWPPGDISLTGRGHGWA